MFLVLKSQKIANYFTSVFGVKNDASVRRRAVGRLLSYWKVMTAYFQPRKFPVHCPWCEYCSGRPDILAQDGIITSSWTAGSRQTAVPPVQS